jgi:hypothetical protein
VKRLGAITGALAGLTAFVVFLAPAGATSTALTCGSGTHGSAGYGYAGLQSERTASGVRATITALRQPSVSAGHAAGWIGVGGPGAGPNGEAMWLQTGVAALPGTPLMVYAEITRAGQAPAFVPLHQDVAVGESHRLAVLEMSGRPGVWRVWLDGRPVTEPIVLAGSHRRWEPLATAESWNGGVPTCNAFGFRFERVGIARALGGSWQPFVPGYTFRDRGYEVRQLSPTPLGHRTLSAVAPQAYAFDALSA